MYEFLNKNKIIPVVVINKIDEVFDKIASLYESGIKIAEITFRTDCAEDAICLAIKEFPDMIVGAGTVVNGLQAEKAIKAGAKFLVSPGVSKGVAEIAKKQKVPYIPGVVTPSDILTACDLGFKVLKFFPCNIFGGVDTLKTYKQVFSQIKFVPTGGINLDNLKDYLCLQNVVAVGGSFMFANSSKNIKDNCKKAIQILGEL